MTRKRKPSDDPARRARGMYVSSLPETHQRTVYARVELCARCGQSWPCEAVFNGGIIDLTERTAG